MIKRELKGDEAHVTFVLPQDLPSGKVSVVGDFNAWEPGVHTLVRRSNGTRSVKVTVPVGTPEPGAIETTVAVKVTGSPKTVGLPEEDTLVCVLALLMKRVTVEDMLVS